jgi:hypothetical protein
MLQRGGEPREVARAILFLCSDDASFTAAAKFHPMGLVRFSANRHSPLLFQLLETAPGVMAKTI